MSPLPPFLSRAAGITCTVIALAGCGNEPTPEQRRADAAFTEASAALTRGDSRAGRRLLSAARSLDLALDRKQRVAEETRMLAELSAAAASFDSALGLYGTALEEYRELADRASVREMALAIAGLHRQMGDERRAFALFTEALRLARVFRDDEGVRRIQWAMVPCARALDATEEESRILRELLQDYTAAGDVSQQANVMLESGNGKYSERLFERAAEDYLHALMLADQGRDSLLAVRATLRLAMTFEASGKMREALANYADCLKRADLIRDASALRLEALVRVGNLYLRNRQFNEAMRFFRAASSSARATGDVVAGGYLMLQTGHCEAESSRESAFKGYRAGLDAFKQLGYPAGVAYASLCLGHLFQDNNQPADALQYFKAAIEQSEAVTAQRDAADLFLSCEQAFFGTRRTPWYDDAIDILLQLGRYDEAFWYVDRRNSRDLFDVLSDMDVKTAEDTARALLESYAAARARFIGAQRQFVECASRGGRRRDLLDEVRASRDGAYAAVTAAAAAVARDHKALAPFVRVASMSVAEVQKALPPGTALVQHVLARRALYAFVITNAKNTVQVAAFEKDRVFDLSKEYVDLLAMRESFTDSSKPRQGAIEQRLREVNGPLYEAFIRPVESAIAAIPTILVVPPRELPSLPLHALYKGPLREGAYLAEQHTISYLPSAGILLLPRAPQTPVREVVALGYAGGTGWDVEYELRDVRAFYKDVRLYFDQQASLATLQKERGDLLHVAAPLFYNEERPGNSFMILSDGRSAETMKRIPVGELLSLPPWTTVVISNLDDTPTGIGPAEPYLFLANGAQQVIFTSHPPSRKAKKYFGEVFYTALLAGAGSRAAYHRAQLDMIRTPEFAGPQCWAWFTLWGQ